MPLTAVQAVATAAVVEVVATVEAVVDMVAAAVALEATVAVVEAMEAPEAGTAEEVVATAAAAVAVVMAVEAEITTVVATEAEMVEAGLAGAMPGPSMDHLPSARALELAVYLIQGPLKDVAKEATTCPTSTIT